MFDWLSQKLPITPKQESTFLSVMKVIGYSIMFLTAALEFGLFWLFW